MARQTFFSFHHERDAWRAAQVRNSGVVTSAETVPGFWDKAEWEEVQLKTKEEIQDWIDDQMDGTSVTVVLIGAETASREYVQYEIEQSIALGKGLLGVRIHNVKKPRPGNPQESETDTAGANPLPKGYAVYDWVKDDGRKNLGVWIEAAATAAGALSMAIDITYLERAAHRASVTARTRTLNEATRAQQQTAFLSHSHLDKERAVGLQVMLEEAGWDVYIDWQHNTMDERPTNELSKELQLRMDMCTWLIYLATANSERSRWCPWEIGYANGRKSDNAILVVPTTSGYTTHGSEYLNLYRRLDLAASTQKMALFERGAYSTGRTLGSMPRSPAHL